MHPSEFEKMIRVVEKESGYPGPMPEELQKMAIEKGPEWNARVSALAAKTAVRRSLAAKFKGELRVRIGTDVFLVVALSFLAYSCARTNSNIVGMFDLFMIMFSLRSMVKCFAILKRIRNGEFDNWPI